jgi:MSHA biogenesis protein MshO
MVFVIMGILSGTVLVFMQRTFSGYETSRARLVLADQGRLALNRLKREVRLSLPNSVRLTSAGGLYYLEFAPVVTAGRYRAGSVAGADASPTCPVDTAGLSDNGVLTIGSADTCFKTLGPLDTTGSAAGDWVVVFNAGSGYTGADYYETGAATGGNKSKLVSTTVGAAETKILFESAAFTWDSPGHRFFIAKSPVSYVCDPTAGTMRRWTGYAVQASQPTSMISGLAGATSSILSKGLASCKIGYAPSSIANQYGLVTIMMQLQSANGDSFVLEAQTQVANIP